MQACCSGRSPEAFFCGVCVFGEEQRPCVTDAQDDDIEENGDDRRDDDGGDNRSRLRRLVPSSEVGFRAAITEQQHPTRSNL